MVNNINSNPRSPSQEMAIPNRAPDDDDDDMTEIDVNEGGNSGQNNVNRIQSSGSAQFWSPVSALPDRLIDMCI